MKAMMNHYQHQNIPVKNLRNQKTNQKPPDEPMGFHGYLLRFQNHADTLKKISVLLPKVNLQIKPAQFNDLTSRLRNFLIWLIAPIVRFIFKVLSVIIRQVQTSIEDFYRFMDEFFMMGEQEFIPVFTEGTGTGNHPRFNNRSPFKSFKSRYFSMSDQPSFFQHNQSNYPFQNHLTHEKRKLKTRGFAKPKNIALKMITYFRLTRAGSLNLFYHSLFNFTLKLPFSAMFADVHRLSLIRRSVPVSVFGRTRYVDAPC